MRRLTRPIAVLTAVAAAALTAAPAPAQDRPSYPVPYSFLPSAVLGGTQTDAPGSNDWDCRPSKARPRPVVLVHGTIGNQSTNWQTYAPLLANEGYCVFALTYGVDETADPAGKFGGMDRMQDSARELAAFVAKVRRVTGAARVDLVGHSQGTLMPNYWLKFLGGARFVKRYISLAPLWRGTESSRPFELAAGAFGMDPDDYGVVCRACAQFAPTSRFMRQMRQGGVAVEGVRYTNIMTEYDQLVRPYTSGRERGMRNLVVQDFCATDYSEHFQIAADPVAARLVLNALDPADAQPVACTVVLPYVGSP